MLPTRLVTSGHVWGCSRDGVGSRHACPWTDVGPHHNAPVAGSNRSDRWDSVAARPLPQPEALDRREARCAGVDRQGQQTNEIWVLELTRATLTRVTSDPQTDWFPTWAPDGERIFCASTRIGSSTIFHTAQGVGGEQPLTEPQQVGSYPTDVSNDGRLVLYHQVDRDGYDLGSLATAGGSNPTKFLVNTVVDQPVQPSLTVILNWAAELRRD